MSTCELQRSECNASALSICVALLPRSRASDMTLMMSCLSPVAWAVVYRRLTVCVTGLGAPHLTAERRLVAMLGCGHLSNERVSSIQPRCTRQRSRC
jgi:hypothetical protein